MRIKENLVFNREVLFKLRGHDRRVFEIWKAFKKLLNIPDKKNFFVIGTRHQPIFYYPGILIKNYLLNKITSGRKYLGLNFIVDTDIAEINFSVVNYDGKNYNRIWMKLENTEKFPYCYFYPFLKSINDLFEKVENNILTIKNEKILRAFLEFKKNFIDLYSKTSNFVDTVISLQTKFEQRIGIKFIRNIKVSDICNSIAFYKFLMYIVENIEEFSGYYNESICEIFKKNYYPIKLLIRERNFFQLPFWYISKNKRNNVFVQKERNIIRFCVIDKNERRILCEIDKDSISEERILFDLKSKYKFFPKALSLTLLFRIFICDLFIHGMGGAVYDRILNNFIKKFFKTFQIPLFYVTTCDIPLPILDINVEKVFLDYSYRIKLLKDIDVHPIRYLNFVNKNKIKRKKINLAKEMYAENDKLERHKLHLELKKIDLEVKNTLQKKIKKIKKLLNKNSYILNNKESLLERTYPYFFYPADFKWKFFLEKKMKFLVVK